MSRKLDNIEVEARFLEVDTNRITNKLNDLGAVFVGEYLLNEIIYYDRDLKWIDEQKFVRLRHYPGSTELVFKHNKKAKIDGTEEIVVCVNNPEKMDLFLQRVGLVPYRRQQKKRASYTIGDTSIDIDKWPNIPPYVEIEGSSEEEIKTIAQKLGLDWDSADTHSAAWIIENIYNIPVKSYRSFTFDNIS